jgi:teichuronic acid biosynthesis glycosyltransferase TuaC
VDRTPHLLLFVEEFYPPHQISGGVRVCVFQQVLQLSRRWRVTVVAPIQLVLPLARYAVTRESARASAAVRAADFDLPGVRILRPRYVHVPLLFALTQPLQLFLIGLWVRLRPARGACVVHGHRVYPMGLAAVLVAHATGLPAVITAHGTDLHAEAVRGAWRNRCWHRPALRWADRVVAVSRDLVDAARSLGVEEQRLRYIPNGVDVESFSSDDRDAARRALGLPAVGRLIVSIGDLLPVKGHAVLIEAFRRLRERRQDVTLLLVGEGPLRSRLEEQIRSCDLEAHVRLLGQVPRSQVASLLAAADVAALPSLNEGMPLAALEALAAGRPLVGSAVGGTQDIVEQGRHGLLVPAGDSEALAAALDAALGRAWDAGALREQARKYSWVNIAQEQERVYAELSHGSPWPVAPVSGG